MEYKPQTPKRAFRFQLEVRDEAGDVTKVTVKPQDEAAVEKLLDKLVKGSGVKRAISTVTVHVGDRQERVPLS